MDIGEKYWAVLDPYWEVIDIDSADAFERTFQEVPHAIGLLYAAHFCQAEVRNGGFTQFFWNSSGVLGPEAVEGFRAVGQSRIAAIVEQAASSLGLPYPRNRMYRWRSLEHLAAFTRDELSSAAGYPIYKPVELFRPLEEEFYRLIGCECGGFETAADEYAARVQLDNKRTELAHGRRPESSVQALKQQMLGLKSDIRSIRKKLESL